MHHERKQMDYIAIIHHDPGSAYGVSFPDLPGCFSAADDEEDIRKMALEALDLWFEDNPDAPEPRSIAEIRREVAEDLADGAYLMAIPYINRDTVSVRRNISMERGMWKAVDHAADLLTNGNKSAFLAMAARNEITRHGRNNSGKDKTE